MAYPLDDYDKILLRHLQADASLSQQELGKIAHLSTAAVNRRLKLLQQAGGDYPLQRQPQSQSLGL